MSCRVSPSREYRVARLAALRLLLVTAWLLPAAGAASAGESDGAAVPLPEGAVVRLGSLALRHPAGVTSVRQTGDRQTILGIDRGSRLRFWATESGRQLETLEGISGPLSRMVRLDEGGERVAAVTARGTVVVIDPVKRAIVAETATSGGAVRSVAMSADGQLIAAGNNDDGLHIWRVSDGRLLHTISAHEGWVSAVAFLPDSRRLVSGGQDFRARMWDAASGRQLHEYTGHREWIWGLDVSPDGRWLATGSWDSSIGLWDLATGRMARRLRGHRGRLWAVRFSPDSRLLASGGDGNRLRLWNVTTGKPHLQEPVAHAWWVNDVAFSADGRTVLTGGENGAIGVYRADDGRVAFPRSGHEGAVLCAAVLPEQAGYLTGGHDGTIRHWSAAGKLLRTVHAGIGQVRSLIVLASPVRVIAGGQSGKLAVLEPKTGVLTHPAAAHSDAVTDLAVLAEGRFASSSRDGTVRVWSAAGKVLGRIETGHGWVLCLAADSRHPDRLLTGGQDGHVKLWSLKRPGSPLVDQAAHGNWVRDLSLSADGSRLVTAGLDEVASLWDVSSSQAIRRLRSFDWKQQETNEVTQSDLYAARIIDGEQVVVAGEDRVIRVWNARSGELIHKLEGHLGPVENLTLLPDGKLLSVSDDGTGLVWSLPRSPR